MKKFNKFNKLCAQLSVQVDIFITKFVIWRKNQVLTRNDEKNYVFSRKNFKLCFAYAFLLSVRVPIKLRIHLNFNISFNP